MILTKFIIDSFAWIEYLLGTNKGIYVKNVIDDKNNEIFTHVLSIAEVSSRLTRSGEDPLDSINKLISASSIIYLDNKDSLASGKLHAEIRKKISDFGLVDAFILYSSKKFKIKILTGDSHFKNFKEAILI